MYVIDFVSDDGEVLLAVEITTSPKNLFNFPTLGSLGPPTSMKLIETSKMSTFVDSVTMHADYMYTGLTDGLIMQTDTRCVADTSSSTCLFAKIKGRVSSVQEYHNEIYALSYESKMVLVYGLDKQLKRSWAHETSSNFHEKLRVFREKVVAPNGSCIVVYTLEGKIVKKVKCPGMTNGFKALAVCGDDSVILSDYRANSVSRINIDSSEVMWTSKHVQGPRGVACYRNRYVIVVRDNSDYGISILDAITGDFYT